MNTFDPVGIIPKDAPGGAAGRAPKQSRLQGAPTLDEPPVGAPCRRDKKTGAKAPVNIQHYVL
jgi:hypothetical protein